MIGWVTLGARLFSSQAYNCQVVVVSLVTQRVRNNVCLTWVVVNFQLVVLDQLEPPSLPRIQIWFGKDVLQAFVVRINMNHVPR
jgi:hypothetical protein